MTSPCYHCPNRSPGCHSTCKDYIAYSEECEKIRQKRKAEVFEEDITIDRINALRRKRHK